MILIRNCRAPVEIRDVELDGNLQQLRIGGQFGDTGWQVPGDRPAAEAQSRAPRSSTTSTRHHHGHDGAMIIGDPRRSGRSRFTRLVSRYNGRQGLSVTAGRGYDFADCEFSHTGRVGRSRARPARASISRPRAASRSATSASPAASSSTTAACGLVADSGDSAGRALHATAASSGTTTWSAWPNKPGFRFAGCTFVGAVGPSVPEPIRPAPRASSTARFTDDPKLSPTGKVFVGRRARS